MEFIHHGGFVKSVLRPTTPLEKQYTVWQERLQKDIKHAFGILQMHWKVLQNPIDHLDATSISNTVGNSLILQNTIVEEKVMGIGGKKYDPKNGIELPEWTMDEIRDIITIDKAVTTQTNVEQTNAQAIIFVIGEGTWQRRKNICAYFQQFKIS